MITSIPLFAGTKLVTGSFNEMRGVSRIPVVLDWSQTVYGVSGTLDDFLLLEYRNNDWEEASLKYFIAEFNKQVSEYGTSVALPCDDNESQYTIVIKTFTIKRNGNITGAIYLNKEGDENPVGVAYFVSDDCDDDDAIAFRDQLRDIGKKLGRQVKKEFKKK